MYVNRLDVFEISRTQTKTVVRRVFVFNKLFSSGGLKFRGREKTVFTPAMFFGIKFSRLCSNLDIIAKVLRGLLLRYCQLNGV